jgi:hypothetical protein
VEIARKTADIISMQLMKLIVIYNLEAKVVGLKVDSTNTNFGGLHRTEKENVLTKIKSK